MIPPNHHPIRLVAGKFSYQLSVISYQSNAFFSPLPAPALPAPALPAPALPNTLDGKQVFLTIVRIFNISFLVGTYSLIIRRKVF